MEIYERIRELRKDLKLSQNAFGEKVGVSRDVISNIEQNRLTKPELKKSLIKLICKEFGVNEEWLENGTEPKFVEINEFNLDDYLKEKGASDFEAEIIKAYFDIDKDIRHDFLEQFKRNILKTDIFNKSQTEENKQNNSQISDSSDLNRKFESIYPPVEIVEKI